MTESNKSWRFENMQYFDIVNNVKFLTSLKFLKTCQNMIKSDIYLEFLKTCKNVNWAPQIW
jgi:hypothetical protein